MNREEEIKKANPYELNEMMQDYAFKKGAKWADEHPIPPSEEYLRKILNLNERWLKDSLEGNNHLKRFEYIDKHWNDEN